MSAPHTSPSKGPRLNAVRTFISSLIPVFFALGVQLIGFVLMAKHLGPSAFGELTVIVSISAIAIELTGVGAGDLLIRAVARKPEAFPSYFGNAIIISASTALFAIALSIGVGLLLLPSLAFATIALLIASETIVGRIASFGEQVAISHANVFCASVYRGVAAVARLLFILLAIFGVGHFSLESWTWFSAANAALVSIIIIADVIKRYGSPIMWFAGKELLDGSYFALNQIARASQANLDRVFLAQTTSPAVIGNYGAAARLVQVGLVPLQIITRMYYPKFFTYSDKGPVAVRSYAIRCAAAMLIVSIGAAAVISAGAFFVPSLLGQGYDGAVNSTIALAWTLPLVAIQYPAADALTVLSLQGLRTTVYVASVLCSSLALATAAYIGGVDAIIAAVYVSNTIFVLLLWTIMFRQTRAQVVVEEGTH